MAVAVTAGAPIDREKLLSLAYLGRGRTRDRIAERRDAAGRPVKATTDELGATVTEHWHDRQDVHIRPQTIRANIEDLRGPHHGA
jgi:hypothetical protein